MIIQRRKEGEEKWEIIRCGMTLGMLEPGYEYRANQLIEPAAPKWPQTTMDADALYRVYSECQKNVSTSLVEVANAAIANECSTGALVPADKVRVIEAKARAEGKREGMNPVHVIEATWRHMKLGRLDPETIQIILLQAAK